jgi:hypothetical protein
MGISILKLIVDVGDETIRPSTEHISGCVVEAGWMLVLTTVPVASVFPVRPEQVCSNA